MNILKFLQTFLKSFITFWVKIFIIFISVRVIKYLYMFIIYILMCIPFLYLHGLVCSKKVIVFYFYNILFPSKTINQGILSNFFFLEKNNYHFRHVWYVICENTVHFHGINMLQHCSFIC